MRRDYGVVCHIVAMQLYGTICTDRNAPYILAGCTPEILRIRDEKAGFFASRRVSELFTGGNIQLECSGSIGPLAQICISSISMLPDKETPSQTICSPEAFAQI